jgi:hypothetical protein
MNRRGFFASIVALFVAKPLISLELETLDVTRVTPSIGFHGDTMQHGSLVAAEWSMPSMVNLFQM